MPTERIYVLLKNGTSSENVIPQVDSKNEWLLLSVTFTAKLELDCLNIRKHFFLEFSF